jgi:hypothetical protein
VFLAISIFAMAAIVIPAIDWVVLIPQRIDRVTDALAPLIDLYSNLERFIDKTAARISIEASQARTVRVETPNSMLGIITASAPHAFVQLFFALLVIYFFLAWLDRHAQAHDRQPRQFRRRADHCPSDPADGRRDLDLHRHDYRHQCLPRRCHRHHPVGARHGLPVMWAASSRCSTISLSRADRGGVAAGPRRTDDLCRSVGRHAAAMIFISLHLIEANVLTPLIVGHRLTINPLLILVSLSFWAWVWGTTGALLAVPLLIIFKTIFAAAGTPDIACFLFEDGTLTHVGEEEEKTTRLVDRVGRLS